MAHTPTIDDYTPDRVRELVEKTPASGAKRSLGAIAAIATLGSLLFGYDTGVVAGALPYMYMPGGAGGLNMTTFEEGWVGGLLCIGAAAGAFFGGRLSDRFGRRHNITLLAIVFLFGAIGCAIAPNISVLYLARIILGFAVGGASATVPVFLSETAPKRLRGFLVATDQMMIVFGQFLAFSMNAAIAHMQGGPTVTLTGDAVDASGHVLGHAGTSVAWETVQAAVNIADVAGTGNGLTWRYMLILCSLPAIALWIGASYWSLSNLRRTQRWIWGATQPIRALTIDRLKSRQVAKKTFTEDDISPFHWVNTRPPTKEQSEEYITLREDDFKDFRLEIGGLVEEEKSFSIDELKALGKVTNITMHTCMQGWTGIAKWEGIRLKDLLEQVTPTSGARYLMATSFGHVGHTYDGRPTEPYYECIDPSMIDDDECILAWGMNDEPLPEVYGGPLRLRADSQHGYKMVKWVRRLEWIHDYHDVGDGQGGSREDSGLQHYDARA